VAIAALLHTWWLSAFSFALHASVWVLFHILTYGYLYQDIPDQSKATSLSVISSLTSISSILGMLAFSLLADYKIELAFFAASIVFIAAFVAVFGFRK
jgi:DMSO/TMAO reductase YedYZ heme-binding membrane subunit